MWRELWGFKSPRRHYFNKYMKYLIVNNTKHKELLEFPMPEKFLEYVKFNREGVKFFYRNQSNNFDIPYTNIKDMKIIIINPGYQYVGRDAYLVKSFILKFTVVHKDKKQNISLLNEENGLIDRIFDIIHFSKYINNFSYSFRNNKSYSLKFDKAIKSYINNNYKHTLSSFGCTKWAFPVEILVVVFLFLLLFLIAYLIVL